MLQHEGKMVSTKQRNRSSVCFMGPNGAAAAAEVDHILTELVEILLCRVNARVARVQTS